jgi:hypothetical protein
MAKTLRRSSSAASISRTSIDQASTALQDLPDKPKEIWSLREAVSVLQESITDALSKGYSYEEVSRMLTQKGVEISASSLKSYLSAARRQKGGTPSRRGGRRTRGKVTLSLLEAASETPVDEPVTPPRRGGRKPKAASTAASTTEAAPKTGRGGRRRKATPEAEEQPKTTAKSTARSKSTATPRTTRGTGRGRKRAT